MAKHHVNVSRDHIERLSACTPLDAIEELIWNGLDSGGSRVEVVLSLNEMKGIQKVEVIDHGNGIQDQDLEQAFGTIGNSKKLQQKESAEGRILHGREGKGRFKALALCRGPRWETVYTKGGKYYEYAICISRDDPDYFEATEPKETSTQQTGTKVVIEDADNNTLVLQTTEIRQKLSQRFALYLSNYPGTDIVYDSESLRIDQFICHKATYDLPTESGGHAKATLSVIEWNIKLDKKTLHLCNEAGFSRFEMPAGVQAPGIDYTAYLCSSDVDNWYHSNQLAAADLDPNIQNVVTFAKDQLKQHLRERLAEEAQDVVEQWKKQEVYPYGEEESANPIRIAERQVFDIVAVRVNEHHPTFKKSDPDNKRLTLSLIKQALESNPSSLTVILKDIVGLPQADQDAFAELLKRTPLTALIEAGVFVTRRLDIIQAFENILFDKDWKKRLLERTQLHRLLVHEVWILDEKYTLDNDDESLRKVLEKHIAMLGRNELAPTIDVKTIEDKEGIPDLMLSRRFKQPSDRFEHLIVELKRPSLKLGREEVGQVENYAMTVARDERFHTDRYRWTFVVLGNELDPYAIERATVDKLPEGCIWEKGNVAIWVRRWADVLAEAKERYEFFREKLQVEASTQFGMDYLQKNYPHLMTGRGVRKKKDQEIMAAKNQPP